MKNLSSLRILFFLVSTGILVACGSDGSTEPAQTPAAEKTAKKSPFPNFEEELSDEDYITYIDGEKVSTREMDALQYIKLCDDLSIFTEMAYKSAVIRTNLQEIKPIVLIVPTDSVINSVEGNMFEKEGKGNLEAAERNDYMASYLFLQKGRNALGDTLWVKFLEKDDALPYPILRDENGWRLKRMKLIGEPVRVQNGLVFRSSATF